MNASTRHTVEGHTLEDRIRTLLGEALGDPSLFVVGVDIRGHAGSRSVSCYVDGDEGVTIDQCAAISRDLGFLLDAESVLKGSYRLSVSSPGVDRPLRLLRQYAQHVGRSLRVTRAAPAGSDEAETLVGRLRAVTDAGIVLDTSDGEREVPANEIQKAVVELPW